MCVYHPFGTNEVCVLTVPSGLMKCVYHPEEGLVKCVYRPFGDNEVCVLTVPSGLMKCVYHS